MACLLYVDADTAALPVAMVEVEGAPVEFIETNLSEAEIWGESHQGSLIYPEEE